MQTTLEQVKSASASITGTMLQASADLSGLCQCIMQALVTLPIAALAFCRMTSSCSRVLIVLPQLVTPGVAGSLSYRGFEPLQGPALYAYNDAVFTEGMQESTLLLACSASQCL